jgi:hypothetical protein
MKVDEMKNVQTSVVLIFLLALAGCGEGDKKALAPNAATAELKPNIVIKNWGPPATDAKKPFNVQPNGLSAIWFEMKGSAQPKVMEAYFGDNKISGLTLHPDKGGSLLIPSELLAKAGKYPVYLMHPQSQTRIDIGIFEVRLGLNDVPNIKVNNWGPKFTAVGQEFNKQPDGLSAIWFEMAGEVVADSMEARFGDKKISKMVITSNKGGAVLIPSNLLGKAGEYPVYLIHTPSNTRFEIGQFTINK